MRLRPGLCPEPRWEILQRSLRSLRPPDPLLRPWTPIGTSVPQSPCVTVPPTCKSWLRHCAWPSLQGQTSYQPYLWAGMTNTFPTIDLTWSISPFFKAHTNCCCGLSPISTFRELNIQYNKFTATTSYGNKLSIYKLQLHAHAPK